MSMGTSCGFAYVHFEQEANAKTAMATLHITNFHGKKIAVKQFKSKKQRLEEQKMAGRCQKYSQLVKEYFKRTVYVSNLRVGSQKKRILEQFFHRDKADSAVVEQRENGQSRGWSI